MVDHLRHFGLERDAFPTDPIPTVFFESPQHVGAGRRLERAIAQRKGLTLLVGAPGSGKTLVTRRLLDALEEEVYDVSLLVPIRGVADAGWILTRFARQLGVEAPARERGDLLAQIYEHLAIVREDGRHAVLMVDEGHVVADPETLQELRGLLNLEYEDRRLLSLVLIGLPELDDAIAADASLAGRIDVRVELAPLDAGQAHAYLTSRVQSAGATSDILAPAAIETLIAHADGIPRLLNTLADNALYEACLAGNRSVGREDVEAAARDLGLTDAAPMQTELAQSCSVASEARVEEAREAEPDLAAPIEATTPLPGSLDARTGSTSAALPPLPAIDSVSEPPSLFDAGFAEDSEAQDLPEEAPIFAQPDEAIVSAGPNEATRLFDPVSPLPDGPEPVQAPATQILTSGDPESDALEAVFGDFEESQPPIAPALALPDEGPPKDEADDEFDELFVELVDEE
jgi:type II secretory pathway predicted ATPase ExeA